MLYDMKDIYYIWRGMKTNYKTWIEVQNMEIIGNYGTKVFIM